MLFIANKVFLLKYLRIKAGRFRCGVAGKFWCAKFPARHRGRELARKCARIALQTMRRMIRLDLGAKMAKPRAPGPAVRLAGLSTAWAALEHSHAVNCRRTLLATHYHELTALAAKLPALACHTMRVKE